MTNKGWRNKLPSGKQAEPLYPGGRGGHGGGRASERGLRGAKYGPASPVRKITITPALRRQYEDRDAD